MKLKTFETFRMAFPHVPDLKTLGGNARIRSRGGTADENQGMKQRLMDEEKDLWIGLIREKYSKDELPMLRKARARVEVVFPNKRGRDQENVTIAYKALWDALQSDKLEMLENDDLDHLIVEPIVITVDKDTAPLTIIELEELAGVGEQAPSLQAQCYAASDERGTIPSEDAERCFATKGEKIGLYIDSNEKCAGCPFADSPAPSRSRHGIKDEPQTNMDEIVLDEAESADLLQALEARAVALDRWNVDGKPIQKAYKDADSKAKELLTPELIPQGKVVRLGRWQLTSSTSEGGKEVSFVTSPRTRYTINVAEEE